MRALSNILVVSVLILGTCTSFGFWWHSRQFPQASIEVTELTPNKRVELERLREEHKFQPEDFPPFFYTGAETPEDEAIAVSAVNGVIDEIVSRPDGPLPARIVIEKMKVRTAKTRHLATEDRDRTQQYMVEIWYLLGFRGSTGMFAYGSSLRPPPGYGEPLPPGWASPTQRREIVSPPAV